MSRPILGAVSYLNTKPLVEGLDRLEDQFELVYDLPSRLADRLRCGELSAALIPIVEAVGGEYCIVSDACIACRGPVWSVKLFSRVPGEQIRTLALDEGSRTSRILSQLLLDRRWGIQPRTVPLGIRDDWRQAAADAVLVIGDRCMDVDDQGFEFSWDLGDEWFRQTELPFVFAVWAAQPTGPLEELDQILTLSRDLGLANLDTICHRYHADYGLSVEACHRYLAEHLHFQLGSFEKMGAELFLRQSTERGLIDVAQLRFFQDTRFIEQ